LLRVEKLGRHHHLLLGVTIGCMGSFPLVHKVEKMSLVVSSRCICSSNSLVSNSTGIGCETAASISVTDHGLILIVGMTSSLSLVAVLASVTLSQLRHEVAIEHSLSHLRVLLGLSKLVSILVSRVEPSNSGLIEDLLLVQSIYVGKHFVDPRVVGGLQHDACLCSVHLIYAKRSIAGIACTTLLLHSVGHEEGLVWLLSSKPK